MTIEEMKSHQWVVSWSGGKDSTATIIKMHELNVPIKEITYIRMMYSDKLPATLPVMTEFVDRTAEKLQEWGYVVNIVPSIVKAYDIVNRVYRKSKHDDRNGNPYGVTAFARGCCEFSKYKAATIHKQQDNTDIYEMLGYCYDETSRLHRLNEHKDSILYRLGIRERESVLVSANHTTCYPHCIIWDFQGMDVGSVLI